MGGNLTVMQTAATQLQDSSMGERSLPLSIAQTDVWRAQKLAPDRAIYNVGGYVEIFGSVNRTVFGTAIRQAVDESDSHLFKFVETGGDPRQVRTSVADIHIPYLEFTGEVDPHAAAMAWMHADMERPFNLSDGPLFRFALLQVGDHRVLWYCAFHHLITDLFGTALFLRHAAHLYNAQIGDEPPPKAGLTSWSEVLRDEEEYRTSARFERDRSYWREPPRARNALRSTAGVADGHTGKYG
jgi:hypothetical protein